MDVPDECSDSQIQLFHNLTRILEWTVGLRRIDIAYKISVLSCYLSQPKTGHLVQAVHIFKYPDQHKNIDLDFDPEYYNFKDSAIVQARMETME